MKNEKFAWLLIIVAVICASCSISLFTQRNSNGSVQSIEQTNSVKADSNSIIVPTIPSY